VWGDRQGFCSRPGTGTQRVGFLSRWIRVLRMRCLWSERGGLVRKSGPLRCWSLHATQQARLRRSCHQSCGGGAGLPPASAQCICSVCNLVDACRVEATEHSPYPAPALTCAAGPIWQTHRPQRSAAQHTIMQPGLLPVALSRLAGQMFVTVLQDCAAACAVHPSAFLACSTP
jgi:hypothetical protein